MQLLQFLSKSNDRVRHHNTVRKRVPHINNTIDKKMTITNRTDVRYRQGARPQRRQRGNWPNTAVSHLDTCFFPVAVETLGPLADEAQLFLAEIGRRATVCSLHSQSAGSHIFVPADFCGNSAF